MSSVTQLRHVVTARQKVGPQVADSLHQFESDLARALASGGRLLACLPEARAEGGMSETVGNEAIITLMSSISKVAEAMGIAATGHHQLAEVAKRMRIQVTAGGDKDELPWP